jgi:hypothetical protein
VEETVAESLSSRVGRWEATDATAPFDAITLDGMPHAEIADANDEGAATSEVVALRRATDGITNLDFHRGGTLQRATLAQDGDDLILQTATGAFSRFRRHERHCPVGTSNVRGRAYYTYYSETGEVRNVPFPADPTYAQSKITAIGGRPGATVRKPVQLAADGHFIVPCLPNGPYFLLAPDSNPNSVAKPHTYYHHTRRTADVHFRTLSSPDAKRLPPGTTITLDYSGLTPNTLGSHSTYGGFRSDQGNFGQEFGILDVLGFDGRDRLKWTLTNEQNSVDNSRFLPTQKVWAFTTTFEDTNPNFNLRRSVRAGVGRLDIRPGQDNKLRVRFTEKPQRSTRVTFDPTDHEGVLEEFHAALPFARPVIADLLIAGGARSVHRIDGDLQPLFEFTKFLVEDVPFPSLKGFEQVVTMSDPFSDGRLFTHTMRSQFSVYDSKTGGMWGFYVSETPLEAGARVRPRVAPPGDFRAAGKRPTMRPDGTFVVDDVGQTPRLTWSAPRSWRDSAVAYDMAWSGGENRPSGEVITLQTSVQLLDGMLADGDNFFSAFAIEKDGSTSGASAGYYLSVNTGRYTPKPAEPAAAVRRRSVSRSTN